MPTFKSFDAFGDELVQMARDMDKQKRKITRPMGLQAQAIAATHARSDLGADRAFSGWHRGFVIPADTQLRSGRDGATILMPTRASAGPWTTVTVGRNQGNAGGFAGPGINTRTGLTARTKAGNVRKVRARNARRWNGTTRGKDTANKAVRDIERVVPRYADIGVLVVIRSHFDVS